LVPVPEEGVVVGMLSVFEVTELVVEAGVPTTPEVTKPVEEVRDPVPRVGVKPDPVFVLFSVALI
jgi:hypothetical protein